MVEENRSDINGYYTARRYHVPLLHVAPRPRLTPTEPSNVGVMLFVIKYPSGPNLRELRARAPLHVQDTTSQCGQWMEIHILLINSIHAN